MIFITAKFKIRPEDADQWPQISADFTEATRNEPGCLWFDWSRSLADPEEYILIEAFRDGEAGGAHVQSDHFKKAQQTIYHGPQLASHIVLPVVPEVSSSTGSHHFVKGNPQERLSFKAR